MIKAILSNSWEFQDAIAEIVPLHRTGVDHGWMQKRAAAPIFDFSKLESRPDETLVHVLALGDGERYGPNRNGDFFPKEANAKYYHTFLSGYYFHHHDNKDPAKAYGRVVAAAHNTAMGRVELIIGLDNSKCAEDLDELEKKGEFPVSMSATVPWDICSICGNKARSRAEYCKHASALMGRILEDGRQVYVINDHPKFFDISRVFRPADRVAWTFRKLDKAASDDTMAQLIGGAELAEMLNVPLVDTNISPYRDQKRVVLSRLVTKAAAFSKIGNVTHLRDIPKDALYILKRASDRGALFGALHRAGICLTITDFLDVIGMRKEADWPPEAGYSATSVALRQANADEHGGRICINGSYDGNTLPVLASVANAIDELVPTYSLLPGDSYNRVMNQVVTSGLNLTFRKAAGQGPSGSELAIEEYAAYLLAFSSLAGQTEEEREYVQNLTALGVGL